MKNNKAFYILAMVFCVVGLAGQAPATLIILNNNFDGVVVSTYRGTAGDPYGADALLGNATGNRTTRIEGSGGVGNSHYALGDPPSNQNPGIRSRDTFDITTIQTLTFSTYFNYNPSTTGLGNFLLLGVALSNATDNVDSFSAVIESVSGSVDHRILFGLNRISTGQSAVRFTGAGRLGLGEILAGTPTNTLTVGNWYQFEYDLLFNHDSVTPADSTVTVSSMSLRDWGVDGVTGGSSILSLAGPLTFNPGFGNEINTRHDVYAYIVGNGDRGAREIDNVLVSAIPEPGTLSLLVLALGAMAGWHRRSRRS